MNSTKLNFLGLIFCSILMFSCGKETIVTVDNPTNKVIKVTFENGYETHIEPFKNERLSFDNLKSSLKLNDGEALSFELEAGKQYILNPCQESYFVEAFEYGSQMAIAVGGLDKSKNGFPMNFASVDEKVVMGYFKEINDIVIEKQWDWDLNKMVPNQIEVRDYGSTIRTKVFRKSNFLSFHERQGM